jgi:hypothetical protein
LVADWFPLPAPDRHMGGDFSPRKGHRKIF